MLKVFMPGNKVTVNNEEATVMTVAIGGGGVRYEVGFWLEGCWTEMWIPEAEVSGLGGEKRQVGFSREG